MNSQRVQTWIGAGILGVLITLSLLSAFGSESGSRVNGSVGSYQPAGRAALFALVKRVGFEARAWRQVPAALPRSNDLVWLAHVPSPLAPGAGKHKPSTHGRDAPNDENKAENEPENSDHDAAPTVDRAAARVGMHELEHYAAFVRAGGTLVLPAQNGGIEFVRDDLGVVSARGVVLESADTATLRDVQFSSAEHVQAELESAFAPLDPTSDVRALASAVESGTGTSPDRSVVLEFALGAGSVVLISDDHWLDNEKIGAHDHALFATRIAECAAPGAHILFDEYALGLWAPESAAALALGPRLALASLHILLVIVLWTWMSAAPRAFARDPEPLERFSPVSRALAQARLFERAGRYAPLTAALRRGVVERIARCVRLSPRRQDGVKEIAARLAPRLDERDEKRLRELLFERSVLGQEDLERLGRDLALIEHDLAARAETRLAR